MTQNLDCIVCGSCVVDMLVRPIDLSKPIGGGILHEVEPMLVAGGGITSNSGVAMARLGLDIGVMSYVGKDAWAAVIRELYIQEKINCDLLLEHPTEATSTTVVAIDPSGERAFYHCVGAPRQLNAQVFDEHIDQIAQASYLLLGYYSLLPNLQDDLPEVLAKLRKRGVRTALDAAGAGGKMQPLDRILPELDVYVPSLAEAENQTGLGDPRKMIDAYRDCGAPGVLGVKLGLDGVLLSSKAGHYLETPICQAPAEVIDTTGAGDNFYGGLLSGLIKGLSLEEAGRLGTAVSACCVTAIGGCNGGRSWGETTRLAGL